MLRAEQANAKEWEGDISNIIMRGNLAGAEKSAAEKLKVNNLIHSRMKR
jgi:hypothetical protein